MLDREFKVWKKQYRLRKLYSTTRRMPFYDIAAKYLPHSKEAVVIDVGTGDGEFADYLSLAGKYDKLFLLDGNSAAVEDLKKRTGLNNIILYKAPDRLPFRDNAVSFVHCSHLIEHLYNEQLYKFLEEVNRVLCVNGIFVVSAPMHWVEFYDKLTHVKPYNPKVFSDYMCGRFKNISVPPVSRGYSILELVYRYEAVNLGEDLGSLLEPIDFLLHCLRRIASRLGLKRYTKNGYTLVLKKIKN